MSKVLISVFFSLAAASANAFDVSGIKLGSSLDEALNGIRAIGKNYEIKQMSDDGMPTAYTAFFCDKTTGFCPDQVAVLKGAGKVVWSVQRSQAFSEPKDRFTPSVLLSSLQKKYGNPSYSDSSRTMWVYDRSGRQQFNLDFDRTPLGNYKNEGPCHINDVLDPRLYPGMSFPKQVNDTCGKYVLASYGERDGFIEWIHTQATDIAHIYDELKRKQQGVEEAQKREAEAQRAKGLKPQL